MRLNPHSFNRFLAHIGQGVIWRRALDCPCRTSHSGAADPRCAVCGGVGQVWDAGMACELALSGQKVQREWAQLGMYERGDTAVTLQSDSPAYAMGEFDRITFRDSSVPFSTVLIRGREPPLRFTVATLERAVVRQGDQLAELPLPVLDERGQLQWPAANGPPPGTQYTLAGRKQPEYFCYGEFPQDRAHHHGQPLPRRVVLRRFDLFGRGA